MHRSGGAAEQAAVDTDAWAREALAVLVALPGVSRVGLALSEAGGRRLRFTASDRAADTAPQWCQVDAYDDVPLNTAVGTGRLVAGTLEELAARYPVFVQRQRATASAALAAVPIVGAGQVLGGFVLFLDRGAETGETQLADLGALGRRLGELLRHAQRTETRPFVHLADEPATAGARVEVHEVPADPAAVASARRFLRTTLASWEVAEDTIDSATLCLSELVTNAIIHTGGPAEVRLVLEGGVLTTTVRDHGPAGPPERQPLDDPLRVHGRGLHLVEALSNRWGSQLDAVGATVWFALDV